GAVDDGVADQFVLGEGQVVGGFRRLGHQQVVLQVGEGDFGVAHQVVLGYPLELTERVVRGGDRKHADVGQFTEPLVAFVHQLRHQAIGDIDRLAVDQ